MNLKEEAEEAVKKCTPLKAALVKYSDRPEVGELLRDFYKFGFYEGMSTGCKILLQQEIADRVAKIEADISF